MNEHPILFSASMVRAILDGKKHQTRRLIDSTKHLANVRGKTFDPRIPRHRDAMLSLSPFGSPGDRLWVRETLRRLDEGPVSEQWCYADGVAVTLPEGSPDVPAMLSWARRKALVGAVCASIHMPRWASRILFQVTEIRVERLQTITTADIIAEGIDVPDVDYRVPDDPRRLDAERDAFARSLWSKTWDGINGKRAPWSSDPWVWVLSFKLVGAPGPRTHRGSP